VSGAEITLPAPGRRSPLAGFVGAGLVAVVVLGALLAPVLTGGDPGQMSNATFAVPSLAHPMGTDDLGREVCARVLYGGRVSLTIGLASAAVSVVVGTLVGALAGFFGGVIDDALMRTTELFQVIPRFLLAIVVVSLFGTGTLKLVLVIGLLSWPATARIMRAQFLVLRREEFVLAAQMSGAGPVRIILRHALPNVAPYLLVSVTLQTGSAILVESFLSFLGLGGPAFPSWGLLLQQAQIYLRSAWWMATFPGLTLSATILGLNLLSDGVEGWLNAGHHR
jgi:peptide/nickel transport system permease protein